MIKKATTFIIALYFLKMMLVLTNSMPITNNDKEIIKIFYIYYLIWVHQNKIQILFNSGNKVNTMSFNYIKKIVLKIWKTNVKAKKIASFALKNMRLVIADFHVEDEVGRPSIFRKYS